MVSIACSAAACREDQTEFCFLAFATNRQARGQRLSQVPTHPHVGDWRDADAVEGIGLGVRLPKLHVLQTSGNARRLEWCSMSQFPHPPPKNTNVSAHDEVLVDDDAAERVEHVGGESLVDTLLGLDRLGRHLLDRAAFPAPGITSQSEGGYVVEGFEPVGSLRLDLHHAVRVPPGAQRYVFRTVEDVVDEVEAHGQEAGRPGLLVCRGVWRLDRVSLPIPSSSSILPWSGLRM